jgi:aspartyl-tRNA(Asn)/glutamyl-tRNA(Gln) amidotransferase subunit C
LLLGFRAEMAETRITLDEVRHVAELARLSLDEDELETMRSQLDAILDYMAKLDELDVSKIDPTFYSVPLDAPLRPDELRPSLRRDEALAAAPASKDGGFAVPKVLDGDG